MTVKTLQDLLDEGVDGRHILVRSDFNVPLNDAGEITDAGRITASLPTLKALVEGGAKVIVMAHLGRPKGEANPKYSLAPVAEALSEALGQYVALAADVTGEDAHERANGLTEGDVLLLENVRFDARETSKDEAERGAFADELAALAADNGAFVSDGFGVVHRAQASVYDVAKRLPAYAGNLVEKEISVLEKTATNPESPYVVVLGGSKVSDKLGVIEALAGKADKIIIGGGMCYTFLNAQGYNTQKSLLQEEMIDTAISSVSVTRSSQADLWPRVLRRLRAWVVALDGIPCCPHRSRNMASCLRTPNRCSMNCSGGQRVSRRPSSTPPRTTAPSPSSVAATPQPPSACSA